MTETTPPRPARRTPAWVKILLGISLALNLAVAGLILGVASRGDGRRGHPAVNYALPYVIALPRQDRRAVFRAMRSAEREAGVPNRGARRALYQDMLTALRAEPFEAQAVRAILTRQTDSSLQVQTLAQSLWLDRVAAMSPQERASYAYRVEEILRRGPRDTRRNKDRDRDQD